MGGNTSHKTRPILTGICYRPRNHNDCYKLLEQSCSNSAGFAEFECIILGDFNTNMLKPPRNNIFINALGSFERMFGLKQFC
jgi:hypothetical protein